jgi:hypothetical protein
VHSSGVNTMDARIRKAPFAMVVNMKPYICTHRWMKLGLPYTHHVVLWTQVIRGLTLITGSADDYPWSLYDVTIKDEQ